MRRPAATTEVSRRPGTTELSAIHGSGRRTSRSLIAALMVALVAGGCSDAPIASTQPTPTASAVVRTVLASGEPMAAAGATLELVRYTIAPGTKLPSHRHPGMQLALVESGTLTYSVVEGSVTVHERDGGSRIVGPGETTTIRSGEWIVETEDIVHFGENRSDLPVVILASSLLATGEPPAITTDP